MPKLDWSRLDGLRARAHGAIGKLPGKAGELARKANEALGRPLADESELADRRAFETRGDVQTPVTSSSAPSNHEAAPVIVYHMDKSRRDAAKLTELLDGAGIPHQVSNIQEDPAAQMAVQRDSKGFRLPLVFIAGEPIGGRTELTNMITSGALKKRVFGG
jgi:glutaredoxin-related protein